MGFKPYSDAPGGCIPWEYLKAEAIPTCQAGMALMISEGKLTPATGATKPTYLSMYNKPSEDGQVIPVTRTCQDQKLVTTFSEDASSLRVGDKVTISDDGLHATATTAGGVLEIVSMDGTAAGDEVIVRII